MIIKTIPTTGIKLDDGTELDDKYQCSICGIRSHVEDWIIEHEKVCQSEIDLYNKNKGKR